MIFNGQQLQVLRSLLDLYPSWVQFVTQVKPVSAEKLRDSAVSPTRCLRLKASP